MSRLGRRVRRGALAVAAAVALLVVTGCGAGSRVPGSDVVCDVDPPVQRTTIDVLAYTAPAIDPFTTAMVSGCGKVAGLGVKHSPLSFTGQLEKAQLSLSQPRGSYDLVEVYSGTLPQYAAKGWLAPLDEEFAANRDRYGLDRIDPRFLDLFRLDGRLYGLPMLVNVHTMVYRADVLEKLGIAPPRTFDELAAAAEKIRASGLVRYPLALTLAANSDLATVFMNGIFSQRAGWVDERTGRPAFATPEAAASLERLRALLPYQSPEARTFNQAKVTAQMQNGDTAIAILYSGRMAVIDDPRYSTSAGRFGFAPAPSLLPGGAPWATLSVDGFGVARNSAVDPRLLFQVMAVGTGDGASRSAVPVAYPARADLLADAGLRARAGYWDAARAVLDAGARPHPNTPYVVLVQNAIGPFLARALAGTLSVPDALAQAQAAAETALRGAGYLT